MCKLELQEWQLVQGELKRYEAAVTAISPQTAAATGKTAADSQITFPLLCDRGNRVARQFGLVFTLPPDFQQMYRTFGIDLAAANGDNSNELPISATYVIDSDGIIAEAFVEVDHSKRMEPAAAIETIKTLVHEQ